MTKWTDFKMDFLQPGSVGDFRIDKYVIPEQPNRHDIQGRRTGYGEFTGLFERDRIWMSDTRAEITDHYPLFQKVLPGISVLITGLGMGMAVAGCIRLGATRVTVIEQEEDVIELVGSQLVPFAAQRDVALAIHQANAYDWWPAPNERPYDIAWHDIWPDISDLNLPQFEEMRAHYAPLVKHWQGCWAEPECVMMGQVIYKIEAGIELTPEEYMWGLRSVLANEVAGR